MALPSLRVLVPCPGRDLLGLVAATSLVGSPSLPAENWPSFRGVQASGVSAGGPGPLEWDVGSGKNVAWSAEVPGLGLSSPVVWGGRVYLTTAAAAAGEAELKVGLYGDIDPADDAGPQRWEVLCYDLATGALVWNRAVHEGVPAVKRHTKSSHANPSIATNGTHIVASFGSEGLYCLGPDGEVGWKASFGTLDSGYYRMKMAQWGFASSPVIHGDRVVVQCDIQDGSFIAALELESGEELWRTARDEFPTWGTPTVYHDGGRDLVAVNGFKHIGAYDLADGSEVWRFAGGGDIPVPTPVVGHGLVFITNAHGLMSPVYAVRAGARGALEPEDKDGGEGIAWWHRRGGNYMQTPLLVGDHLFACSDLGILSCFDARTGERLFRERLRSKESGSGFGFTASPVSDGEKLYFFTEDGRAIVTTVTPEFEVLADNDLGGECMASPALVDRSLLVRTRHHLHCLREE